MSLSFFRVLSPALHCLLTTGRLWAPAHTQRCSTCRGLSFGVCGTVFNTEGSKHLDALPHEPCLPSSCGAPGNEMEAGQQFADAAVPALDVIDDPHPMEVRADVGVSGEELVKATGQFHPGVS